MNGLSYKGFEAVKLTFHGSYSIYKDGKFLIGHLASKKAVRDWINNQ